MKHLDDREIWALLVVSSVIRAEMDNSARVISFEVADILDDIPKPQPLPPDNLLMVTGHFTFSTSRTHSSRVPFQLSIDSLGRHSLVYDGQFHYKVHLDNSSQIVCLRQPSFVH